MYATFHLLRNILRSNVMTPAYPYKITFAVTYRCNSKCLTCKIWKRKATPELPVEEIESFFRANPGIAWLDLAGGEVFLRKDFIEICASAIRHCPGLYLLHFPTNGLLVDRVVQGVKDILALSPKRLIVSVSLDGPRELHDRIRGGKGYYSKAIDTLRKLRALTSPRFQVYPGMTLSSENLGQIDRTLAALQSEIPDFKPNELHINIAQVSEHFYGNTGMDTSFQKEALEEIRAFSIKRSFPLNPIHGLENAYLRMAGRFVQTGRTPLPCQALSSSCFIEPDGKIYPCVADNEVVGNIGELDYDLNKAWKTERFAEVRKRIREGRCPHCWTPCEAYQTLCSKLHRLVASNVLSLPSALLAHLRT